MLTFDSNRNELVADWSNVLINGGSPVTGWVVDWLRNSDPAATDTPLGGGVIERTNRITNPATRRATFASPGTGDWSVQLRASNALGDGLRKRATVVGTGTTTTPPEACVSDELLADVEDRIQNNNSERWTQVKNALTGQPDAITLAEVEEIYDRRALNGWSTEQWDPVIEAMECLEEGNQ